MRKQKRKARPARRLRVEDVEQEIIDASLAFWAGDQARLDQATAQLVDGPPIAGGAALVDLSIIAGLRHLLGRAWSTGWQPADVVRAASRKTHRSTVQLLVDAIAFETAAYRPESVHPRWRKQVDAIGATAWWVAREPYLVQWMQRFDLDRPEGLRRAIVLLSVLHHLPPIPMLCPPPGGATSGGQLSALRTSAGDESSPILERVRALLSKAESTTFPEEAEALSAKAQELMAAHSIDRLATAGARSDDTRPVGRRLGIDQPYAAPKSLLLANVAEANRCRSVWTASLGFSTVIGGEVDVDAVDILFTSLLSQATSALRAADQRSVDEASGIRSFRRSFYIGYAVRIGTRLAEVVAAIEALAEASTGSDLLPVLTSRAERVAEALDEAFPGVNHRTVSAGSRAGWATGMAAAEEASLSAHSAVAATAS